MTKRVTPDPRGLNDLFGVRCVCRKCIERRWGLILEEKEMTNTERIARYHVHMPRHSAVMPVSTLSEARALARAERRDGWTETRIVRLSDSKEVK